MKISIKLDKSKRAYNDDGHPIIIYITKDYKEKKIRTDYRSHLSQWNEKLSEPNKRHPEYYQVYPYIQELKSKISKISFEATRTDLTIDEIVSKLFRKNLDTFFDLAIENIGRYNTKSSAIKSFNRFAPNVKMHEVTPKLVERYFKHELKTRKARGVDSYKRSLRAVWNIISDEPNPFKVSIKIPEKENRVASTEDLILLKEAQLTGMKEFYRDCWLLMFYLGGIDLEALARLRNENIVGDRVCFNRSKGNSETFCSNIILPEAWGIINKYKEDYFVPIHRYVYREFRSNFSRRFKPVCKSLGLSVQLSPKNVRHTFIDRAQQLLIDERITGQIVGHKFKTTTSLYANQFPRSVQDDAHAKIVAL